MNTLRTKSETKQWLGLIVALMTLAVALSFVACLALLATPHIIDAVMLRSLADELGTQPTQAALITHVTDLLESQKGSSRADIHRLLDDIGGFTYLGPDRMKSGESVESAYWTLAELPLGLKVWTVWILRYDANDRLIDAELLEFRVLGSRPR